MISDCPSFADVLKMSRDIFDALVISYLLYIEACVEKSYVQTGFVFCDSPRSPQPPLAPKATPKVSISCNITKVSFAGRSRC